MPAETNDPGLPTHAVENQPPPLPDLNLFESDRVLKDAVAVEGGGWAQERLAAFGALVGSGRVQELGRVAGCRSSGPTTDPATASTKWISIRPGTN